MGKQSTISMFFAPGGGNKAKKPDSNSPTTVKELKVTSKKRSSPSSSEKPSKRRKAVISDDDSDNDVTMIDAETPVTKQVKKSALKMENASPPQKSSSPKRAVKDTSPVTIPDQKAMLMGKVLDNVSVYKSDPKLREKYSKSLNVESDLAEKADAGNTASSKPLKYTPLEQQVVDLRRRHPGVLLCVEVGYKFQFFGDDAESAAKVLSIFSYKNHNFMTASIPVHRVHIHVKRLVEAGYKVGIVRQTETAALKAVSENKSKTFSRRLTDLYTKGTLVEENLNALASSFSARTVYAAGGKPSTPGDSEPTQSSSGDANFLMCLWEESYGNSDRKGKKQATSSNTERVKLSFVAVDTSTGDLVYDDFEDTSAARTDLETRVMHIRPSELLLPSDMTHATERFLKLVSGGTTDGSAVRLERCASNSYEFEAAVEQITKYWRESDASNSQTQESSKGESDPKEASVDPAEPAGSSRDVIGNIGDLPAGVVRCLGCLLNHLRAFNMQSVLSLTRSLRHLSKHNTMILPGTTLRNLEIMLSEDGSRVGSLCWLLDETRTPFGGRMLRRWIQNPLLNVQDILNRLDAVDELANDPPEPLQPLIDLLGGLPDLERGLCQVHCNRSEPRDFFTMMAAFLKVLDAIPSRDQLSHVKSDLLRALLSGIPDIRTAVRRRLDLLSEAAAMAGDKTELFVAPDVYPAVIEQKNSIAEVTKKLESHLADVRKAQQMPNLAYKKVMQEEYLIEVPNSVVKRIPKDWLKISSTKAVSRFRTPYIGQQLQRLAEHRDRLKIESDRAWLSFLGDFGEDHFVNFRTIVQAVAELDCLRALAVVALRAGYVKPEIMEEGDVLIEDGRHPTVEALRDSAYIPNDANLGEDENRCLIITGPNMGGKSSYIRQTALIAIMGQIGSFVPARKARLRVFDAVYTRMGASDNIGQGLSTFLVELREASDILHRSTRRSLVILDELGRGTSTHDGTAIAYATLKHIIEHTRCAALFVTHYPVLGGLRDTFPDAVRLFHMGYIEEDSSDGIPRISFLYKLTPGVAERSYGLNVAHLAKLPSTVIARAAVKAKELEDLMVSRAKQKKNVENQHNC
eukprot:Rmarinus@m.26545